MLLISVIDETFDGSNRRVIYGPVDVAKAARIYTLKENKTLYNADSDSQFANGTSPIPVLRKFEH